MVLILALAEPSFVALVGTVISIATFVFALVLAGNKAAASDISKLEDKIDEIEGAHRECEKNLFDLRRSILSDTKEMKALYAIQLGRGFAELEAKGLGKAESPLVLSPEAEAIIAPLRDEMKAFYDGIGGNKMSLIQLTAEFELKFGKRIIKDVCVPYELRDAGCLLLAIGMFRPIDYEELTSDLQKAADELKAADILYAEKARALTEFRDLRAKKDVWAGGKKWFSR